jgi:hypothetical protein
MRFFNLLTNALADFVMWPWKSLSPWYGLTAASLLTAGMMVFLFHRTSNQSGVRRTRNRLLARTLELLLFRHSLSVSLTACGRILVEDARYLATLLRPMLVGAIPILVIFIQLSAWLEWRPLKVGESAVLDVELDSAHPVMSSTIALSLPEEVRLDSEGVRIPSENSVSWRLTGVQLGAGEIQIRVGDLNEVKSVVVGEDFVRVSPQRLKAGFWNQLLSPSESSLSDGPIVRVDLRYPPRTLAVGLRDVHWTIASVLLMMAFGLVLGWMFGVRLA